MDGMRHRHPVAAGLLWFASCTAVRYYARAYLTRTGSAETAGEFFRRADRRLWAAAGLVCAAVAAAFLISYASLGAADLVAGVAAAAGLCMTVPQGTRMLVFAAREVSFRHASRRPVSERIEATARRMFPEMFR
jgi:hypothetical protein